MIRRRFPILLLAASLLWAPLSFAKAEHDGKEHGKEHNRSADAGPAPSGSAGEKHKKKELTDEQKQKRKEHMAELRAKWGEQLRKPGVKDEMREHMKRMAKLRKIAKVAKDAKKEAVEKRAEAAMKREKERHDKKMEALKAQPAPAGSASAAPSAPATTGGAK